MKYAQLQKKSGVRRYIILLLLTLFTLQQIVVVAAAPAEAHFFGAQQSVDGFVIIFQPSPQSPVVGQSATLNFSILEEGSGANLLGVYSAVTVSDKKTGATVFQDPYRFYETSDITVPYTFDRVSDYSVTIQARIPGHEKYQEVPLSASFDVSAFLPGIPIDELMIYYATPPAAAAASIAVYLYSRKML